MEKIKGLIVAPFTAFDKNNVVNLKMVTEQAEMYKRNGLSGVFICGTTGESSALTMKEKKQLFEEWSKQKTENFKVIAFLGGTCIEECIELAKYALELKLDAVSVTAPYYFRPTNVKTLVDFCIEIANAVPSLPLYYYHIPCFTNAYFPMIDFLKEIDGKTQNFAGIKYTDENIMDYQLCLNYENNKYDILWGRDEMLLAALATGAMGAVGSTYGYMSPVYNSLMQAFDAKDFTKARAMQLAANKLIQLLGRYGGGTGKAFMREAGLELGEHRLPIANLSQEQLNQFKSDLEDLDFSTYKNK